MRTLWFAALVFFSGCGSSEFKSPEKTWMAEELLAAWRPDMDAWNGKRVRVAVTVGHVKDSTKGAAEAWFVIAYMPSGDMIFKVKNRDYRPLTKGEAVVMEGTVEPEFHDDRRIAVMSFKDATIVGPHKE